MAKQPALQKRAVHSVNVVMAQAPEQLFRELISRSSNCAVPGESSNADFPEILFDMRLDGYSYQLVRRPADRPLQSDLLSPREKEIARMVGLGYPNKTIAAVLEISMWTVGTHLRHAFAKLGVNSRAALVAKMIGPRSDAEGKGRHDVPQLRSRPADRSAGFPGGAS